MVILTPTPQFVIKTRTLIEYDGFPPNSKLFINVCYNDQMPVRPIPHTEMKFDELPLERIFKAIEDDEWTIPIAISPKFRATVDKSGKESLVIDAILNSLYMKRCLINVGWKNVLAFWLCNEVEDEFKLNDFVDRDQLAFPKRMCIDDPLDIEFDLENFAHDELSKSKSNETDLLKAKDAEEIIIYKKTAINNEILKEGQHDRTEIKTLGQSNSFIVAKETKKISKVNSKPESSPKITFTIQMKRLEEEETLDKYNYLLKVSSELKSAKDYEIQYKAKTNELIIKTTKNANTSKMIYPLNDKINVKKFVTFFVTKESTLYLFIK